jgi:hypothetical protein
MPTVADSDIIVTTLNTPARTFFIVSVPFFLRFSACVSLDSARPPLAPLRPGSRP